MARPALPPPRKRDFLWFLIAALLPLPWIVAFNFQGLGLLPEMSVTLSGLAIVGAAFLLSWTTELAERDVPQALALLVLALASVLPEYAVDLHFAWKAGVDPSFAPYAVANMTGANRLLIGLGWPSVALLACWRTRKEFLTVDPRQRLEIRFLLLATIYSFFIPIGRHITLIDAAVLLGIFFAYVIAAMGGESHEVELVGPAALIDHEFGDFGRRIWAILLFSFSAFVIFISAEPFADGLVHVGRNHGIDEFLLVQWLAPVASESPEFVIALLFAIKRRGSVGLGALISSKVNQWTLLVGAIPIAYCVSASSWHGLPLDARQMEELWLTSAQSLLATILIANLRIGRSDGILLAVLFLGQLCFPNTKVRYFFIGIYLVAATALLLRPGHGGARAFASLLRSR
ncbi:MAG TPA: sodium:calcium antiporter [Myxococcota bacterium]|nr:sodium:calcium antiporter [Myxococcota bacterium]